MALLIAALLLTRISSPIVVDGVMNDEAWRTIEPLPLTMYLPVFRGEPTQRSEIRVAYDAQYVYIGGWFYDTDPKGIRINSLYRDRWSGDDALAIYIDGFNDDQNAKWFGVTAAGMRFDQLVSDDGNTLNDNWDGFWDAKTTVTNDGWFVEVRIPFSTIGFQEDAEGRATMGLTVTRLVSRLGERVTFPAIDPKFPFRRPSAAQDVTLQGVTSPTPFYLTPYVLAGRTHTASTKTTTDREVGVDARFPFTPNLTLDLTANTDFAQVGADEQQVALDRLANTRSGCSGTRRRAAADRSSRSGSARTSSRPSRSAAPSTFRAAPTTSPICRWSTRRRSAPGCAPTSMRARARISTAGASR